MALGKFTLALTNLLICYAQTTQGQSDNDTKSHISSDKVFTIQYPALWKQNKAEEKNAEFCINAPGVGLLNICMVKAEINKIAQGYENADIHELSDAELKILKAQPENQVNLQILESSFKKLDDHEWWIIHGKLTYDNKVYFTNSYKTIHNQKVYVFTYFSNEKKYLENKVAAENIIFSVAFLTKNTSVTKPAAAMVNNASVDSKNEKVSNTPQTTKVNSPVTTITKKENTHVNIEEFDFAKEPEYIRKYGEGKVRRISEGKLEVTLTAGNKIMLNDVNDAKRMIYKSYGYFIGYSDEWNTFIFAGFESGVKLFNRTTGEISDEIFLKEIEQKNDTSELSYDGLHFYKVWSPEKKWLAIVRNSDDGGDAAMELVLYDIQQTFKKKYEKIFAVSMFQNSNIKTQYWEPGELRWLDNNTLEIKKIRRIGSFNNEKFVGMAWLIQQNGKWVLTNIKPVIKK
jgi:hypothetical protein